MAIREQNLETIAPVLVTFKIHQTSNSDDLMDTNIGQPVTLTGPIGAGDQLLGKLISLTLNDGDDGQRLASVQVGGICRLLTSSTYPSVGNRLVGGVSNTVKQATTVASDPAGGNIARGTVLAVNGTTDCVVLLN